MEEVKNFYSEDLGAFIELRDQEGKRIRIKFNNNAIYLASFVNEEDAASAYKLADK